MLSYLVAGSIFAALVGWIIYILRQDGKNVEELKNVSNQVATDNKIFGDLKKQNDFEFRLRNDATFRERMRTLVNKQK